jgi:hypothetical protein
MKMVYVRRIFGLVSLVTIQFSTSQNGLLSLDFILTGFNLGLVSKLQFKAFGGFVWDFKFPSQFWRTPDELFQIATFLLGHYEWAGI